MPLAQVPSRLIRARLQSWAWPPGSWELGPSILISPLDPVSLPGGMGQRGFPSIGMQAGYSHNLLPMPVTLLDRKMCPDTILLWTMKVGTVHTHMYTHTSHTHPHSYPSRLRLRSLKLSPIPRTMVPQSYGALSMGCVVYVSLQGSGPGGEWVNWETSRNPPGPKILWLSELFKAAHPQSRKDQANRNPAP